MKHEYYPSVVIIGRPNVGKSTLFNMIIKQNVSIVEETPGVTRDRIIRTVAWGDQVFDLVDTGGIGTTDEEALAQAITFQIKAGIEIADIIIFMVDIQTGIQVIETEIAKKLHKAKKNVLLVANKADSSAHDEKMFEFMELGFGEPMVISVKARRGLEELRTRLTECIPAQAEPDREAEDNSPHIAIVGRRNVGKSSLVNALADEERVLVSSIPGTTRDAVDVEIKKDGTSIILIDTAGIRKKRKVKSSIEFYGSVRTERSIRRADGVFLMIDAVAGIGKIDKQVAGDIAKFCKPCVIVVNKWDLAGDVTTDKYIKYISGVLRGLYYVPVVFISASEHERIWSPVEVMMSLFEQAQEKIQTSKLNNMIQAAVKQRRPPAFRGKSPRIFYAVQTDSAPPTFRIFTSDAAHIKDDYKRFIAKYLREHSLLKEVPLKIEFVSKEGAEKMPSDKD